MLTEDDRQIRIDLIRTHDRLSTKGWTTGKYGDSVGPNCLVGAMRYEAVHVLPTKRYLREVLGCICLVDWNDSHKKEDVLDLIETGITKLEEEMYKDKVQFEDRKQILQEVTI